MLKNILGFNKKVIKMKNIDNMLKKVLGKTKRNSFNSNINKILGKNKFGASFKMQNKWKSFSPIKKNFLRKILKDTDRDRVPNIFDCQPYNYFKQEAKYNIPRWLLNQLTPEQQVVAKDMLFNKKMNIGLVADHFEIKHPSSGARRPYIFMSDEELIAGLKELGQELGRTPTKKDIRKTDWLPSDTTFTTRFGTYNQALELAGFNLSLEHHKLSIEKKLINGIGEIKSPRDIRITYRQQPYVKEKTAEYVHRPEVIKHRQEYERKFYATPVQKERRSKYSKEYLQRSEVKEYRKEYAQRPAVKKQAKEYRERPEIKKHYNEKQKEYFERPAIQELQKKYHKERYRLQKQGEWQDMTSDQRAELRQRLKDTDGDRVPDDYDCDPNNVMQQHKIIRYNPAKLSRYTEGTDIVVDKDYIDKMLDRYEDVVYKRSPTERTKFMQDELNIFQTSDQDVQEDVLQKHLEIIERMNPQQMQRLQKLSDYIRHQEQIGETKKIAEVRRLDKK